MKTPRKPRYPLGHGGYFHSIVTVDESVSEYGSGEYSVLKELYEVVDYFVILVGSHTHTGNVIPTMLFPGGFLGMSPRDETRNWWGMGDKVVVVMVDVGEAGGLGDEGSLHRESFQRDATLGAVREIAHKENVEPANVHVIVSDADEIIKRSNLASIRSHLSEGKGEKNIMLMLQWHVYNFGYLVSEPKDGYASLEWGVIAREAAYATTLERMEGKSCTDERYIDYDKSPFPSLPSIIPHAGWHLASFGGADEVINKIKNTCCNPSQFEGETFEDLKAMESLMENGIPYYQAQGWGETVSDIAPVWLDNAFDFGIGVPSAAQGCRGGGGGGGFCKVLFPEKVQPTFKQSYALNQRMLKLNKESGNVSEDYTTTHNALKSEHVDELKCACGEEAAEVERYNSLIAEKIGRGLDYDVKAVLVQRLVDGCAVGGGGGVTSTLVRHDDTHYLDVVFDDVGYVVALKRWEDAEQVAKYHCEGMGMDDESCVGLTSYLVNVWQ
ncbi:hypothetical protein TL16_g10293 [Triparma laevis f. inornata]|uniref:Uncharacterized protein n=1 Tax=Triparma laevis f. inornata TaxID=1714386 RepID=A0A9W7B7H4_9STRA|nr:hypothetical protein TL16_g10293 [Triparma laevis f. inornata]